MNPSFLQQIRPLMPIPESPIDTDEKWLKKNERSLKLRFPTDFVEFSRLYGSGQVMIRGGAALDIWSAFRPNYPNIVRKDFCVIMNAQREAADSYDLPLGIYPERGGLLPFGTDSNGIWYTWKTSGKPDDWRVVVLRAYDEDSYWVYEMGFTEYLYKLVARKFQRPGYTSKWDPKRDVAFRSRVYYGLDRH